MFRLTKWYLDLATRDGTAFIGYAAHLRWGAFRVRYASTLFATPGAPVRERFTLLRARRPRPGLDGALRWRCPGLGVEGSWGPRVAGVRRRLYASPEGVVDWDCLAPAADVRLRLHSLELEGVGYAERLRMTVAPWLLPMDELRWGRFAGSRSSMVWIDWRGTRPFRLVLLDGREVEASTVADNVVAVDGARLELGRDGARPLRRGPLADVLTAVPGLVRLLPERIGGAEELKWLTPGRQCFANALAETGWAIHEVVTWPTPART